LFVDVSLLKWFLFLDHQGGQRELVESGWWMVLLDGHFVSMDKEMHVFYTFHFRTFVEGHDGGHHFQVTG